MAIRNKQAFQTLDLAYMAIGAVLIAVCSWISIPASVPFTLQTFAVFFVLSILGGKRGTVSVLLYILLGAIGIPVFAGFSGGIGVIMGSTGGYIVGFILMGLVYWGFDKKKGERIGGGNCGHACGPGPLLRPGHGMVHGGLCPAERRRFPGHSAGLVRDPLYHSRPHQAGAGHRPFQAPGPCAENQIRPIL